MERPFNYTWDWSFGSAGSYRRIAPGFPSEAIELEGDDGFLEIEDDNGFIAEE